MPDENITLTPQPNGPSRRTILAGAAWSVPAIVAATATPALAASSTVELAFDQPSYSGAACDQITGVTVTATEDGVALAGESVTVTLSDGYEFEDGSTTFTGVTGSDGTLTLPAIVVPASGTTGTFVATADAATATATASGTSVFPSVVHWMTWQDGETQNSGTQDGYPEGATLVGSYYYLLGTDLYAGDGTLIATDVTDATGWTNWDSGTTTQAVNYQTADGVIHWLTRRDGVTQNSGTQDFPAGATLVGGYYYLLGTDLYAGDGTLIASDVTDATGWNNWDDGVTTNAVNYETSDGVIHWLTRRDGVTQNSGTHDFPAGATLVGSIFYLLGTDLYANDGTLIASDIVDATGWTNWDSGTTTQAVNYTTIGTCG